MTLVARIFDVAIWAMFLGSSAYLGVWLDRVAFDLAERLTGYIALVGLALSVIRWGMFTKHREK